MCKFVRSHYLRPQATKRNCPAVPAPPYLLHLLHNSQLLRISDIVLFRCRYLLVSTSKRQIIRGCTARKVRLTRRPSKNRPFIFNTHARAETVSLNLTVMTPSSSFYRWDSPISYIRELKEPRKDSRHTGPHSSPAQASPLLLARPPSAPAASQGPSLDCAARTSLSAPLPGPVDSRLVLVRRRSVQPHHPSRNQSAKRVCCSIHEFKRIVS